MKNTRSLSTCLFLGATLLCQTSYAVVPAGLEFNLYGGVSYTNSNPGSLFLNSAFPERDTLTNNQSPGYDATGGLGLAYDFLTGTGENNNFIHDFSVGIDFFSFNTNLNGDVLQFGKPALDNFNYDLNIKTTRLMLDGQLNFHPIAMVTPFLSAGLGVTRVLANYKDTPVISSESIGGGVSLPSNTNYNAAYALGAGVKVPLTKNVQISFSYLYTYFGTAETGTAPTPGLAGTIEPVKITLRTQTGLVGLTYAFFG